MRELFVRRVETVVRGVEWAKIALALRWTRDLHDMHDAGAAGAAGAGGDFGSCGERVERTVQSWLFTRLSTLPYTVITKYGSYLRLEEGDMRYMYRIGIYRSALLL